MNEKQFLQLLSNQLEIDCIEMKLTQQTGDNPIIYEGSGSIFQDEDGCLNIKMFHAFKDYARESSATLGNTRPGKIIKKENFFALEAMDMTGVVWKANDVYVSGDFSFPAAGKVIKTPLGKITRQIEVDENQKNGSSHSFFMLKGKYNIPCNKSEDLPNGGFHLNTCKFKIGSIDEEIKSKDNSLYVWSSSPDKCVNKNHKDQVAQALSFIFGQVNQILYSSYKDDLCKTITIHSISDKLSNKKIASPINHAMPHKVADFSGFIEKYLDKDSGNIIYGYWHKIQRAWQSGFENAALSLCVAIEGIIKEYFNDLGAPDGEILQQAEIAKKKIASLEIGERIKQRLLSNIGNLKSSNPKNSLHKLEQKGLVEKRHIESWQYLRNKSAHADKLDEGQIAMQKYIDEFFVCLNLFHILVLHAMDFNGKYMNYGIEGWLERDFPNC